MGWAVEAPVARRSENPLATPPSAAAEEEEGLGDARAVGGGMSTRPMTSVRKRGEKVAPFEPAPAVAAAWDVADVLVEEEEAGFVQPKHAGDDRSRSGLSLDCSGESFGVELLDEPE